MNHKIDILSCTLAAMAGVCFIGGLLVLTGGEPNRGNGKPRISSVND